MYNVIFLDMDGVLTSPRLAAATRKLNSPYGDVGCDVVDFHAARFLSTICLKWNAKIVIVSVWRKNRRRHEWNSIFMHTNLEDFMDHKDWRVDTDVNRSEGIKRYMAEHPVDDYIIVDDETMSYNEEQMKHLIQTSTVDGMMFENYVQILERTVEQ